MVVKVKLYNPNSKTGKRIITGLQTVLPDNAVSIYDENSTLDSHYTLIRWGDIQNVRYKPQHLINNVNGVKLATNKLETLTFLKDCGINVPDVTMNIHDTRGIWLGRRLHHRGGTDITINGDGDFFTKYIPNIKEYRVHVMDNRILGVQEKILEENQVDRNDVKIRNHSNGYKFILQNTNRADNSLKTLAKNVISSLGLTFGAIDIIETNDVEHKYYVLEVNTAPGLESTMFNRYIDAMATLISNLINSFTERDYYNELGYANIDHPFQLEADDLQQQEIDGLEIYEDKIEEENVLKVKTKMEVKPKVKPKVKEDVKQALKVLLKNYKNLQTLIDD